MKIVEDYVRDLRGIRYSEAGTDELTDVGTRYHLTIMSTISE